MQLNGFERTKILHMQGKPCYFEFFFLNEDVDELRFNVYVVDLLNNFVV